jgi:membrane-bound lytic murein transglycosylase A
MKDVMKAIALFCLSLSLVLGLALVSVGSEDVPLRRVDPMLLEPQSSQSRLLPDESLAALSQRQTLLAAIAQSLNYLQTPAAAEAYRQYPVPGVTRDRVQRTLERFRQLVLAHPDPSQLQIAVLREFDFYQAIGTDGAGAVEFTGYFEPTYRASRVRTAEYQYPLYRLPPNLAQWVQPHPTRLQLEGTDGLQGSAGLLRGLELVWLSDRLEAFLVQVQGSARLQLTDGSTMTIGYAGRTEYPYTSLGRELVNDSKFTLEELSLPVLIQYFEQNPADLDLYIPRNDRFVFFRETRGAAAIGSLGVPVTAERSIATDKSLMPPGALALIHTQIPYMNSTGELQPRLVSRFVLDQDTGGAIRGAGRVDIFMGTGEQAGDRAGLINGTGQLYYLLLKD